VSYYFDAAFLARLYVEEAGFREVRKVARNSVIRSSILGKMETEAAFHRKFRESFLDEKVHADVHNQFFDDIGWGLIVLLPLTPAVVERVSDAFLHLPTSIALRAGDAIHLATAAEAGFKEIYSNDRHLLGAATLFKLKGINPLAR
jgi:predicted nucleic acid-binding protein